MESAIIMTASPILTSIYIYVYIYVYVSTIWLVVGSRLLAITDVLKKKSNTKILNVKNP
jgi:RecG-like helicase